MLLSDQRLTVWDLYLFLIVGNWLTVRNSEPAPSEEAFTDVQCFRTVAEDRPWLNSALVDAAIERETGRRSASQYVTGSLTSRERQVTLLVADGLSNKEVGRRLGLSEGTVKIHLHNIYQKLHVNNRTALAALAITHRDEMARPRANVQS
jgi:two-component system nitrate/nitrite response regulator NarL